MDEFLNTLGVISHKRLSTAIELGGIGFWDLNLETGVLISSARCKANFGRGEGEEPSFEEFAACIYEDDYPRWREATDKAIAECSDLEIEYRIVWDDGSIHWVLVYGICSCDENGKATAMSGISIDITERKQIEERLRKNQENLANTQRIARVGNWEWNLQTNQITLSEESRKIFGIEEDNYEGLLQRGLKKVHVNDRKFVESALQRALDQIEPYDIEYRVTLPNKPEKTVHSTAEVIFDKDNKPLVMNGTIQDITDFKTAERERTNLTAQIKSQQQYINNILINLPGAIWESRVEKNAETQQVDFISDYIEKMTGYPPENWVEIPNFWLEAVHPDDRERVFAESQKIILAGGKGSQQFRWLAKNGDIVWVETNMVATFDEQSEIHYLQGITMNISDRKNAEEALKKREEELLQSQKLESVGRLAGGIAHDFNNMLTAINGYSDLILRNLKETDPLYKKVSEIRKAGERSASLTQQLLAFSRQQIMQPKKICLNQIIRDTNSMLNRVIGEDIKITTEFKNQRSPISVDPGQMMQVILNLAVNSRDAMPYGGTLSIQTENIAPAENSKDDFTMFFSGEYVKLTVSDTGGGMDEETLAHIFEPFYTTKEVGKGTGLGLATVYGIVKQSGGHIRVASKPDRGTTFSIYFPLLSENEAAENQNSPAGDLPSGSETVLLVEDEQMVRQLICRILESSGYKIIEAADGQEALSICRAQNLKVDLLITDVVMPEMSGHELAKKLIEDYPEMKIVYMSGYTNDIVTRHGITKDRANFIQKPFSPEELTRKVHQLLNKQN